MELYWCRGCWWNGLWDEGILDSKIQMGIDVILDLTNFESIIQGTDYIITGEGKLDSQSLRGKVVIGVARRAKRYNKKVIAVVGCTGPGMRALIKRELVKSS
jgi:glycerate kinase